MRFIPCGLSCGPVLAQTPRPICPKPLAWHTATGIPQHIKLALQTIPFPNNTKPHNTKPPMANSSYTPVPTFDNNLQSLSVKMPPPPTYGETVASPSAPGLVRDTHTSVNMDDYEENDEIEMITKGSEEDEEDEEDTQGSKGKRIGKGKRIRRYSEEQDDECCGLVIEAACCSCKFGFCGFNVQLCGCLNLRMWSCEVQENEEIECQDQ